MATNLCKVKRVMMTLSKTLTRKEVMPQGIMMWGCQRIVRRLATPIPEHQEALPPPPERVSPPRSDSPPQRPSGAVEEEQKGSPAVATAAKKRKRRWKRVSPLSSVSPPQRPSGEGEERRTATRRVKVVSPPSSPSPANSDRPVVRSRRLKEKAEEKRKFVVFSPRISDEEMREDFIAIMGYAPPPRPKKPSRELTRDEQNFFPNFSPDFVVKIPLD